VFQYWPTAEHAKETKAVATTNSSLPCFLIVRVLELESFRAISCSLLWKLGYVRRLAPPNGRLLTGAAERRPVQRRGWEIQARNHSVSFLPRGEASLQVFQAVRSR
jgi:hypothetical protein